MNATSDFQFVSPALPLDQVAEAYRAMDQRRAIKALLRPAKRTDVA